VIWTEVAIRVPRSHLDAVTAALLASVPAGIAEVRRGRGTGRTLLAYLPRGRDGRSHVARIRSTLAQICPVCSVTTRAVSDAAWKDAWRMHARPVRLRRLVVVPSWWRGLERARAVVRIDPGQAFGSGEHPSTQLCLRAVDRYVRDRARVIDVGTGSGILAIAAAALGARPVVAVDNDPVAVTVARANSRRNGVAARIRVERHDGLRGVRMRADLIVANLTADTLGPVVERARTRLKEGGRFVAAGFTTSRLREVASLVRAAGLRITDTPRRRGWRAIHAVRPNGRLHR
jgi:ribosomal protein L11 methyltransferase